VVSASLEAMKEGRKEVGGDFIFDGEEKW